MLFLSLIELLTLLLIEHILHYIIFLFHQYLMFFCKILNEKIIILFSLSFILRLLIFANKIPIGNDKKYSGISVLIIIKCIF